MKLNTKTVVLGCLLLLAAAVIFLISSSKEPAENLSASAPPKKEIRPTPNMVTPKILMSDRDFNAMNQTPEQKEALEKNRKAALEIMDDAATSYDAAELPKIQPYLVNPDPQLREAAMNAMIVLGDASAGAMMREAAKSMSSPEEAVKLLKSADYVELPSADIKKISEHMKKKKQAKENSPAPVEKW